MNRNDAEQYVYNSFLKAEQRLNYSTKDAEKRHPELTRKILRENSKTPCVVVTGSKGKGSISNMVSHILQTQLSVGMMTSPHLLDFLERFKVNGVDMPENAFVEHMELIKGDFDEIEQSLPLDVYISPIGIQAALGLMYFNSCNTEFNVFECGKGARYDDVRNIKHDYAIIGTVFLEHTRELGDSLEMIAEDKAYVINETKKCVYIAEQELEVMEILQDRAKKYGVRTKVYGREFEAKNIRCTRTGTLFDVRIEDVVYDSIEIPLLGYHQAKNCALAMALCKDILKKFEITDIRERVKRINWPGRMEIICENPFVILDACINRASCMGVKSVLKEIGVKKYTLIVGIPDDKDYVGVVKEMENNASQIILTKSHNNHYIFTNRQLYRLDSLGTKAIWTNSIIEALELVDDWNNPILILGTTSLISEVKRLRKGHKYDRTAEII